jgi:hypothetical protein
LNEQSTVEYVEKRWRRGLERGLELWKLLKLLNRLSPEEAGEFRWKHRVEIRHLRMELSGQRSRSGAFEWERGQQVALELAEQGLLDWDTLRDRRTGRLVKTIVRELGRLTSVQGLQQAAALYERAHTLPLPEVKHLVRAIIADSRSDNTPPAA